MIGSQPVDFQKLFFFSVSRHSVIILNLFVTQAMSPLYVKNLSSNLQHDQGKIMPFLTMVCLKDSFI